MCHVKREGLARCVQLPNPCALGGALLALLTPARGSRAARRLLAAVAALALVASAAAVATPTTTVWSGASTAQGVAGSPTARTPFFSYYSNWQFNVSTSAYPALNNQNYNMIRASPAPLCPAPAGG